MIYCDVHESFFESNDDDNCIFWKTTKHNIDNDKLRETLKIKMLIDSKCSRVPRWVTIN